MIGTLSQSGGSSPSVTSTWRSVSRYWRSKSSSAPELWSAPYHQNQSDPSAMYISVIASSSASGLGGVRTPFWYLSTVSRTRLR